MALFYSAASLSGAFSGLLAFGLQHMEGIGGLAGWRWIFIIEGLFTVVVGFGCFSFLPDSPETASFLKPEERRFLCGRLRSDSGTKTGHVDTNDKFHWPSIRAALLEWKIWLAVIIYWVRGLLRPYEMRSTSVKRRVDMQLTPYVLSLRATPSQSTASTTRPPASSSTSATRRRARSCSPSPCTRWASSARR